MRSLTPLLLILIVCGCDIFRTGDVVRRVTLQPGMEFTYHYSFIETDSTFTDSLGFISTYMVKVTVLDSDTTIAGHENLIQLRVTPGGSDGSLEETQDIWYIQNREALTEIAHRNPAIISPVVPKMSEKGYYRQRNTSNINFFESGTLNFIMYQKKITDYIGSSIPADSIQIREDPRIVLQYPIQENNEWTSFTNPFTLHRKVIEVTENELTGQSNWTASIQSWYDPVEIKSVYFDWVDRFDKHGLISRIIKSTHLTGESIENEEGRFHTIEKVELIDIAFSVGE